MSMYATVEQVWRQVDTDAKTGYVDDSHILDDIRTASARIDEMKGVYFEPVIETKYLDARGYHITNNGRLMDLGFPLLALGDVTLGDGTALTLDTNVYLHPRGQSPVFALRLPVSSGYHWTAYNGDYEDAVLVEGTWGFHPQLSTAWKFAGTITDAINADVIDIEVSDASQLSAGLLLRVGNEYMRLLEVTLGDTSDSILVERGANGSVAASHNAAVRIEYWQVYAPINQAAARYAAYLYKRRGAFERAQIDETGTTLEYSEDMPPDVRGILDSVTIRTIVLSV